MPHTTLVPATDRSAPATQAAKPATELSLDERLTLVNTLMTLRLDEAAVGYEVNTAHIDTGNIALDDVITLPLTPVLQPPPAPYATPVAALLQRAHHRLATDGWCSGALTDSQGAVCLYGAIQRESHSRAGTGEACAVLLDAIRREFPDAETVPGFNDAWPDGRVPLRILGQAADLAHTLGL